MIIYIQGCHELKKQGKIRENEKKPGIGINFGEIYQTKAKSMSLRKNFSENPKKV